MGAADASMNLIEKTVSERLGHGCRKTRAKFYTFRLPLRRTKTENISEGVFRTVKSRYPDRISAFCHLYVDFSLENFDMSFFWNVSLILSLKSMC